MYIFCILGRAILDHEFLFLFLRNIANLSERQRASGERERKRERGREREGEGGREKRRGAERDRFLRVPRFLYARTSTSICVFACVVSLIPVCDCPPVCSSSPAFVFVLGFRNHHQRRQQPSGTVPPCIPRACRALLAALARGGNSELGSIGKYDDDEDARERWGE